MVCQKQSGDNLTFDRIDTFAFISPLLSVDPFIIQVITRPGTFTFVNLPPLTIIPRVGLHRVILPSLERYIPMAFIDTIELAEDRGKRINFGERFEDMVFEEGASIKQKCAVWRFDRRKTIRTRRKQRYIT
jgi:hypothetical protein